MCLFFRKIFLSITCWNWVAMFCMFWDNCFTYFAKVRSKLLDPEDCEEFEPFVFLGLPSLTCLQCILRSIETDDTDHCDSRGGTYSSNFTLFFGQTINEASCPEEGASFLRFAFALVLVDLSWICLCVFFFLRLLSFVYLTLNIALVIPSFDLQPNAWSKEAVTQHAATTEEASR